MEATSAQFQLSGKEVCRAGRPQVGLIRKAEFYVRERLPIPWG